MTRSVLVVDDDDGIREVLAYNLEQEGYAVRLARSAEEAWESFHAEAPDLVITDVRMAGKSGLDLLRRIKELVPDEPVIVITAYGDIGQAVEAMRRGAHDYITKPFHRDALKLSVRKALEFSEMRRENFALREELSRRFGISGIVGQSPVMQALFSTLARVAATDSTVLIEGETGTGKELVARAIHHASPRAAKNFVTVNCTAIPRELLESELFGHVQGAFTGATRSKTGKFELADGGTIFLDEIGDIDGDLQKKLLRVLQEKEIDKVGSDAPQRVDARVVAATNQPLAALMEAGRFRKDLYYRLNVVPIVLPPLRERMDDLPILIRHFLDKLGAPEVRVIDEAMEKMRRHGWPGNVRELQNTMERALILREKKDVIAAGDISFGEVPGASSPEAGEPRAAAGAHSPVSAGASAAALDAQAAGTPGSTASVRLPEGGVVLDELEKEWLVEALSRTEGNQSAAARLLGLTRQTLIYRMQKHGIRWEKEPGRT